jgi:hypothetical protein
MPKASLATSIHFQAKLTRKSIHPSFWSDIAGSGAADFLNYRYDDFVDPTATSAAPPTSTNPINSGDIGMIFLLLTLVLREATSTIFSPLL